VTPPTVPEALPIVAIMVELLIHVPPDEASASVAVAPWQTVAVPVMAKGTGLTVTIAVALQPEDVV
jgi:hypothetical protein